MPKPPTQSSIAKSLGISRATVAEILGGSNAHRYNDETRRKVTEMAKALNYRPNRQARLLAGARSATIGIIKSISTFQRNAELVLHAGEQITEQGYEVMSSDIFWHTDGLERAVNTLIDLRAEGVILAHLGAELGENKFISRLREAGIPMISIGGDPIIDIPYVTPDYRQAGHDLAHHFLDRGYTRLSIVDGRGPHSQSPNPTSSLFPLNCANEGFIAAAIESGKAESSIERPLAERASTGPGSAAIMAMESIFDRGDYKNRGVAFLSDFHATAALQYCHKKAIQIPEEIGITGFDGSHNAEITWPALTTVQHPTKELAQTAVDLLLTQIREKTAPPPVTMLPCRIIERASTRPLP